MRFSTRSAAASFSSVSGRTVTTSGVISFSIFMMRLLP